VYAEQQANGSYMPVRKPLTDDALEEHLAGVASYGVYTVKPVENTVRYIVLDLDTYSEAAWASLQECVEAMLVDPLGEWDDRAAALAENSGGKGYHVWIFLDEPISALRAQQWAAPYFVAFKKNWELEIFPKQTSVDADKFGNLTKLPFGIHAKSGNRSEVVPVTGWADLRYSSCKVPTSHIPQEVKDDRAHTVAGSSGATPFPCINVLKAGVGQGQRDDATFRLACYYHQHGLDEDLALAQLERDNEHNTPPLEGWEIDTKLKSAYSGDYRVGCDTFLQGLCPGGDECKARTPNSGASRGRPVGAGNGPAKTYLTMTVEERKAFRESIRT